MPENQIIQGSETVFDPFGIPDPTFPVRYGDGTKGEFECFATMAKLEAVGAERNKAIAAALAQNAAATDGNAVPIPEPLTTDERVDEFRKIFGYPTSAEYAALVETGGEIPLRQKMPSVNAMLAIVAAFYERFKGIDSIKKLQGLMQDLYGSASSPRS